MNSGTSGSLDVTWVVCGLEGVENLFGQTLGGGSYRMDNIHKIGDSPGGDRVGSS